MSKRAENALHMAILYQRGQWSLRQIGTHFGISGQTVKQRLASMGIALRLPSQKYLQIDKMRLESLYLEKRLAVREIAQVFDTTSYVIFQALKFHEIPRRKSISTNGKHIDLLRELKIGDKTQMECRAKEPYGLLHGSARGAV